VKGEGHVALFVPSLHGGGAEQVMLTLANGFASRGLRVDLVLVKATGALLGEVSSSVRLFVLDAPKVIASLPHLVKYLRCEQPSVLLSTLNTANVVAVWASQFAATPTRTIVRQASRFSWDIQIAPQPRKAMLRSLVRWSYPRADVVVAVSSGVATDLARTAGVPRTRIRTLPSPLLRADVRRKAEAPLEHPWFDDPEVPVVLGVGRLSVVKGFTTLLHAFARARQQRPCRLVILGEGPERERLEALSRELGVESDVCLPGFSPNPFAYMARAGVFVLSSASEGSPGVLIQALACGAPVVATECDPAVRELLGDGELGETVAVGDSPNMARAIRTALDRPKRRAPDAVVAQFDEDRAVDGYLRLLTIESLANA
jgi:glycosyltransferase involved in cell wall biosynthesis